MSFIDNFYQRVNVPKIIHKLYAHESDTKQANHYSIVYMVLVIPLPCNSVTTISSIIREDISKNVCLAISESHVSRENRIA